MRVSEAMTHDVRMVSPFQTIREAAKMMMECDCGIVPVSDQDRLVGMITDRDIAIRAIAQGKGPDCLVGDAMTMEVKYCYEDEDTGDVLDNLGELQIRRLPVLNRDKRLVGILSLGDLAVADGGTALALARISKPGGLHNQSSVAGRWT